MRRGFTLIELLLTVSIAAILSVGAIAVYVNAHRKTVLDTTAAEIVSALRLAQSRALNQEESMNWGVRFEWPTGGTGFYAIFKDTYTPGNTTEIFYLPAQVQYTDPGQGSAKTVTFIKRTGTASTTDITIALASGFSLSKTIHIYATGAAEIM